MYNVKQPLVFHPLLIALFFPLSLYAHGANKVLFGYTVSGFLFSLSLAVVILVVTHLFFLNINKSGIVTFLLLIYIFSFGYVVSALDGLQGVNDWFRRLHKYSFELWTIGFVLLLFGVIIRESKFILETKFLNAVSLFLCIIPTMNLVVFTMAERGWEETAFPQLSSHIPKSNTNNQRNIFYLIFDRYGSSDTLSNIYGFDNHRFLNHLRKAGFIVPSKSVANYQQTAHSLASSLNMEYIDDLSVKMGEDSNDWRPLFERLENFKVQRLLREQGYKYFQLGSWWNPTRKNKYADENFVFERGVDFFSTVLLKSSPLMRFGEMAGVEWLNFETNHCYRVLKKFEKLKEIARSHNSAFVFAHFLIPHPPYVFDANGNCLEKREVAKRSTKTNYLDQVQFTNHKLLELIDTLLHDSNRKPIIIVQADEGPYPDRYKKDKGNFDWRKATELEIRQKMEILNCFYFPDIENTDLLSFSTPVNTFRMVFNKYFDGSFEILPDKNYVFVDEGHLYQFVEVTEKLK